MKGGLVRSRLKGLGGLWIEFEGREKKKTLFVRKRRGIVTLLPAMLVVSYMNQTKLLSPPNLTLE